MYKDFKRLCGMLSVVFLLVLFTISSTYAFSGAGGSYTISGSVGYGAFYNSGNYSFRGSLGDGPVWRQTVSGKEICSGSVCKFWIPVVGQVKTFLEGQLRTEFEAGSVITIRINVSDFNGGESIDSVVLNLTDPNSRLETENASMSGVVEIPRGYTYEYNKSMKVNDVGGTWNISSLGMNAKGVKMAQTGSFLLVIKPAVLWIDLNLEDNDRKVYIPGTGEVKASQLSAEEYLSPEHYYLASYLNQTLYGLVFFYKEPFSLRVNKSSGEHKLTLSQQLRHSNVFLVSSKGDWKDIDKRMVLIEGLKFFQKPYPSFGFGLGIGYPVEVLLEYAGIDIQGSDILQKGYHKLGIISNRTDAGKAVEVRRE